MPFQPWLNVAKATQAEKDEIARLVDQMPGMRSLVRQAFLKAIDQLGSSIDGEELIRLLRAGQIGDAIAMVTADAIARGMTVVGAAAMQAALNAGAKAALAVPLQASGGVDFRFGPMNRRTVDFLQRYEFDLIRELTVEARRAVATYVADGVANGINPIDIARDVRTVIGLTQRQATAVMNYRRLLEQGHADAMQRALRDRRFDRTVAAAITGKKPLTNDQIDRMVQRYLERYLKYRSETIARTEAMRSLNIGNHLAWQQAIDAGRVVAADVIRKWVFTHDGKTRHAHVAIPSLNPDGVGMDEPFQSPLGPIRFPGDPDASAANTINCRCTVVLRVKYSKRAA